MIIESVDILLKSRYEAVDIDNQLDEFWRVLER